MKRYIAMGLAAAMLVPQAGMAHEIEALTISPDGGTLLVAGDNRVLYRLATADMSVSERRYIPEQIKWISYSEDGDTVFLRTNDGTFQAVNSGSFKVKFSADDVDAVSYAPAARRIALLDANYKGGILTVLAATSGKQMSKLEMPDIRTTDVALSADGNSAILLTSSKSSDAEEKVQPGSDLKGYPKYVFRQEHDGYISQVVSADLKAGSFEVADTYFRVSQPKYVQMMGDAMTLVNGVTDSAMIAPDGSAKMMDMGENYVGHSRISNDGTEIIMSTNRDVRFHPFSNGVAGEMTREVKGDDIGGPSERVTAITEGTDGTIYLGTSAYRIWKIAPGSDTIEAATVY